MFIRSKTLLLVASAAVMAPLSAAAQESDHDGHNMPGHSMADMDHDRSAHMVEAMATVTATSPAQNQISLSHAAIPTVSWPAATMKFPVGEGIDVAAFKPGERVQFTLHRAANGGLPLVELCKTEAPTVQPGLCTRSDAASGHNMGDMKHGAAMPAMKGHGAMDHSKMSHGQIAGTGVTATGTVLRIDTAARGLRVKHDPIPEIGWPVMTMQFEVADGVDLTSLSDGDAISFDFDPETDDGYVISAIRPATDAPPTTQSAAPDHSGHDGH